MNPAQSAAYPLIAPAESMPQESDQLFTQANTLLAQQKFADAIACYDQLLKQKSDHPELYNNYGVALAESGQVEASLSFYEVALKLKPEYAEAHYNRGNARKALRRFAEALEDYEQAIRWQPQLADAWTNRGQLLHRLGMAGEAVASFKQAIKHRPGQARTHDYLGMCLRTMGDLDEALKQFDEAIRLNAAHAAAHVHRAETCLLRGDYAQGWAELEWRLKLPRQVLPPTAMPRWDGMPLAGRSILLRTESNINDTLQFIRYSGMVKLVGAGKVYLECPPELKGLLASCPGVDEVVGVGAKVADCDAQIPLLSLPLLFDTDVETIPHPVPYLSAQPERVQQWKEQIPEATCRLGIVWHADRNDPDVRYRSLPLVRLTPLADLPGVRLVGLQTGAGSEQVVHKLATKLKLVNLGPKLDNEYTYLDTAAVLASLDALVTCDAWVAHLAGALGRPVYLALPPHADWRWLRDRDDSPWYPNVRLFRRGATTDWEDVIARIATELQAKFPA
jgi:tetratricopeptide (TPR) repeat protein